MGFIMFIAAMVLISLANTTKESRKEARLKYNHKFRWLWFPVIAVIVSFFVF